MVDSMRHGYVYKQLSNQPSLLVGNQHTLDMAESNVYAPIVSIKRLASISSSGFIK